MKRSGEVDTEMDDEMQPEYDLSKAVPGYTAFRIGEDPSDEASVVQFWIGLGFEVERITEPALRFSKAPDFLLRRHGTAVAVCEVKSMGELDYTVKVNHADGSSTETKHNWRESDRERVLHRADRAMGQLSYWNGDHALVNILAFVNHDPRVRSEEIAAALREMKGIDATFWFDAKGNSLEPVPVVVASEAGRQRLEGTMNLLLETRLKQASAA